jgi:hypothetical protein
MQHRRRMIGYAIPEEIAADWLFETQGNVAEAQRLARLISLARTTTGTYRGSTSLKARTGMGVRADGKVIFAMSQGEVSFDAFGRLFRDGLNCPCSSTAAALRASTLLPSTAMATSCRSGRLAVSQEIEAQAALTRIAHAP